MLSASGMSLGQTFNHSFDALMTLSGCGHGNQTHQAMSQMEVPTFIMSGSHDCICPPEEYADIYHREIPETTCKYLAVIRNATHCHFGEEGFFEDESCELTEKVQCNGVSYNHISEEEQHSVVMEYYSLFMEATLKSLSIDKAHAFREDAVARQLQHDLNRGIMRNIAVGC